MSVDSHQKQFIHMYILKSLSIPTSLNLNILIFP